MTVPAWVVRLVAWCVPASHFEEVLGDLEEVHRRRVARRGSGLALVLTSCEALALALWFAAPRARRALGRFSLTSTDLRLAVRASARSPIVTVAAVSALTVGVTLAATGFSLASAILTARLPFEGGERAVSVGAFDPESRNPVLPDRAVLVAWRGARSFQAFGAFSVSQANVLGPDGEVELVSSVSLTPSGFSYVQAPPLVGRSLGEGDAGAADPRPVVLSRNFWERRFGADPGVVGTRLDLAGSGHMVVGVVADVGFPAQGDVYLPLSFDGDRDGATLIASNWVGVLRAGVDVQVAEAELTALAASANAASPVARLAPLERPDGAASVGGLAVAILLALLAVIAGNVGNLMVARAMGRREELAVRAALGAGRARLVAGLAVEAAGLVAVATVSGLLASRWLLAWFAHTESDLPPWVSVELDVDTVLFAFALAGGAAVLAGVLPALKATRGDAHELRRAPRAGRSRGFGPLQEALLVIQIAAAVGVLGASLMINRGWAHGSDPDGLVRPDRTLITARVRLPDHRSEPDLVDIRQRLLQSLSQLPGVTAVSAADHLPGLDASLGRVEVEGVDGAVLPATVPVGRVDAGFFRAIGAAPVAGGFPVTGGVGSEPGVAVVNHPFVMRHLGGANAVGRRVRTVGPGGAVGPWMEIVGVAPDLGMSGTDPERAGGVYLPLGAVDGFRLLVEGRDVAPDLVGRIRSTAFEVDPMITLEAPGRVSDVVGGVRRVFVGIGSVFAALGGLVLLLSLLGIYAVLSWEADRNRREVGIRLALGARREDVLRPIGRRVAFYALAGGALGSVLGTALIRLAREMFLFRFPETGGGAFAALVGVVLCTAAVAAMAPAISTSRVHPADALRAD